MKKNRSLIAGVVISLVLGYLIGAYVGIPGVGPQLLSGDIGKVNKYNKAVSEEAKAFQERMENDSTFRNETLLTLGIVDSRINQFKNLTDSTAIVAKGIKELESTVAEFADMQDYAQGAQEQADSALAILAGMATGKNSGDADYEQLAQNTFIAYTIIDRQKEVARDFVSKVDAYLDKNYTNTALADIRNKWVVFCGDGAMLEGNKEDVAYWDSKSIITKMGGKSLSIVQGIVFNRSQLANGKKINPNLSTSEGADALNGKVRNSNLSVAGGAEALNGRFLGQGVKSVKLNNAANMGNLNCKIFILEHANGILLSRSVNVKNLQRAANLSSRHFLYGTFGRCILPKAGGKTKE